MNHRRILGRIERAEFVGRDRELAQLVRHPSAGGGLALLAAPPAGVTELLRQTFDELFSERSSVIPIYYAFNRHDRSGLEAAQRFFTTFLQQYIAYARVDPALCDRTLTLQDLAQLAVPSDHEWITGLLESFATSRAVDEAEAVRFCFGAPQKASRPGQRLFAIVDELHLADRFTGRAVANILQQANHSYVLSGARRHLFDLVHSEDEPATDLLHLEGLTNDDAQRLVDAIARRHGVEINGPTRDLIVQQLGASPFLISSLVRRARAEEIPLTSFLNCQRAYVDEILGGRIQRYFAAVMKDFAPDSELRRRLIAVLYESFLGERKVSLESWKKRLGAETSELEEIVRQLHVLELVNANGSSVEMPAESFAWHDYLRSSYRLDVTGEARALVAGDTLRETLKRAPRAMARQYRREAALGLRELISGFDCQQVPATLFQYDRFAASYKGVDNDQANQGLDAEAELIRLPQVVQVAAARSFAAIPGDDERSMVGHAFDAADYTDAGEIVWLAAEIESKLEASRELTEEWLNRLTSLARDLNFTRTQIWLIAPEGFSRTASQLLKKHAVYYSSRRQVELLSSRIRSDAELKALSLERPDDYEMVIPMGDETELIAAQAVEQIARRLRFPTEAINQIKTAIIEACINAAEHSLSPDRKIYQRFRAESDKLVVIVASRGVVPGSENGLRPGEGEANSRRGWGLKLIQSLMDEVEFQRVDDGTQLRMVKYLRK